MPTTTHKAHAAWLARLTGRCDAGQPAENSDHQRGSSATHCAAGSSVLAHCGIKFAEKGMAIKAATRRVMFSQSREQTGAPVPRFLSVFLAFGGLTPWFLNLSSVLYPPPPAPPAALPSPHPQLTHNLSPSHPSPHAATLLPSPPTALPQATALPQPLHSSNCARRTSGCCRHAPCSVTVIRVLLCVRKPVS